MQTLKTAVVVVLLLVVLYGFYTILSKPEAQEAAGNLARELVPPQVEMTGEYPPTELRPMAYGESDVPVGIEVPPDTGFGGPQPLNPPSGRADPFAPPSAPEQPGDPPSGGVPQEVPVMPAHPHLQGPLSPMTRDGNAALQAEPVPKMGVIPAGGPPLSDSAVTPAVAASQTGKRAFAKARQSAQTYISHGRLREALYTLSIFFNSEDLTSEESRELLDLLDPLASRVVYSQEHLLEPAYEVRGDERLSDIASRYRVPTQLLQNINGIRNPDVLVPGTELKVV